VRRIVAVLIDRETCSVIRKELGARRKDRDTNKNKKKFPSWQHGTSGGKKLVGRVLLGNRLSRNWCVCVCVCVTYREL